MQVAAYEQHHRHYFKYDGIPFIFHQMHLARTNTPFRHLHWHENPEFLRCHAGCGEIVAGRKQSFAPGDLVVVNPNDPHGFMAREDLVYDYMIVDARFCKENGVDLDMLRFSSHLQDPRAIALFDHAFSAANTPGEFHVLAARSAMLEFLRYLCDHHREREACAAAVSGLETVKQAVIYIHNHYAEAITLHQVAAESGFSVYHFSREFKRITGQTFVTFLNTVRCERAALMLNEGSRVSDAAAACGFSDLAYFSRTFCRYMGAPPSKFRRV